MPAPKKSASDATPGEVQTLAHDINRARFHIKNEFNKVDEQIFDETWRPNWDKLQGMLTDALELTVLTDEKRRDVQDLLAYGKKHVK